MAHRNYAPDERAAAVARVVEEGLSAPFVAREMSVSTGTLQRWISDAVSSEDGADHPPAASQIGADQSVDLADRLADALRRIHRLEGQLEQLQGLICPSAEPRSVSDQ